ncbi:flagellar hook assembly protein FlgD [Rummeliibacillus sp. TYF005]|uniref:flagellar hook assembly protein FlgD n=1 Tax=unclassified Rummeliibacillus TaxID=2622809 RepID=UPI000E667942|nr:MULTISPECIES: flagellar hook assembly protein FlgD [unclassified Rummeliibacillus]RIJ69249.1 flagellar hook assembly protein FlgD [Rummeliibacillus sp. POC4]RPJ96982.1 flagellar hook assembly protein FlgD [Rummeliibacillus sp. TYF005]
MAETTATNSATSNTISSDYYLANKTTDKKTGKSSLDKDAFLQLLVTQLQNQDPTSPMDDKEFISQMAQFSSLEQMQNVAKSIDSLSQIAKQSQLMQYNSFIGKNITWHEASDKKDEKGNAIINTGNGIVSKIAFSGDSVKITLEDGKTLDPANISEVVGSNENLNNYPNFVNSSSSSNSLVEASLLIGKNVSYKSDTETSETTASVKSAKKSSDGNILFVLSNGKEVKANQLSSISE